VAVELLVPVALAVDVAELVDVLLAVPLAVAVALAVLLDVALAVALAVDVAGRNEKLKAEGTVSDVQARQVDTQARAAEAQLKVARAALQQAQAARRKHQLFAQFSGVLVDAPDQVGGMAGPGMPVYVIQQLDPLLLKTTIPETLRPYVRPGLRVRVESVAGTATSEDAILTVVIPSADPQSRRIPVEITIPNRDGRFVANTLARVTFSMGEAQQAFIVPSTALGSSGGEFVMAVQGSAVRRVAVTVTQRGAKEVTVLAAEPLREVVDFVHTCVHSTIKALKFSHFQQICGGPVELAVISTDRNFRWVRHKEWTAAVIDGGLL
jgi:RND family efflux transporter MFP subunit